MSGLRVVSPGLLTTIQDLGRPGDRSLGVPVGGAFDVGSFRLANALAGNEPNTAALELTLLGGTYEAIGPIVVALAGAPMEARIEPTRGPSRPVRVPSAFCLEAGDRLVVGGAPFGARTYLAVPDGFAVERVLGSAARETPLAAGELLVTRPSRGPTYWPKDAVAPVAPEPRRLRLIVGPDAGRWPETVVRVGVLADRMGIRLESEERIEGATLDPDRLSTPVAPGALQWTGSGWILLGVAGGTMGGYPVVAQVIRADLDEIGQLRPGDRVRFTEVTLTEAIELGRRRRDELDRRDRRLRLAASGLIHGIDRSS